MGQTLGKAQIHHDATPFVNLASSQVDTLSRCVYEVGEGFGLSRQELRQIIEISLSEYLKLSKSSIDECSDALFALFNSSRTASPPPDYSAPSDDLIDSFELLSTICIVSAMRMDEKLDFLFNLFDFNDTSKLSINEVTFILRAVV
eukprot:788242_1